MDSKRKKPFRKPGAMCYMIVPPAFYREYICPLDGEKTVYTTSSTKEVKILKDLIEIRRVIKYINSITDLLILKLDEQRLCHKCNPDLKEQERYLSLITIYPDGKEHVYNQIEVIDLYLLERFFYKRLENNTDHIPFLKEQKDKIQKILGA